MNEVIHKNYKVKSRFNDPANEIGPHQVMMNQVDNYRTPCTLVHVKRHYQDESQERCQRQDEYLEPVFGTKGVETVHFTTEIGYFDPANDHCVQNFMIDEEGMESSKY